MKQNRRSGQALWQVVLAAMWRRKGFGILLFGVAALGVFASAALQNLTVRQEAAMAEMVRDTQIHCVVTDAHGTDSDNLGMFSAFVDMLLGLRRERGCYLDEYVKNVRAKASFPLEQPADMTLRRILSFDSDSALADVAGVRIELAEGWAEAVFQTDARVCMAPEGLGTQPGAEGQPCINVIRNGVPLTLQVIGTVYGGPGNVIWCPFYLQQEGVTEAFLVERCSFDICLGLKGRRVFGQVFAEQVLLAIPGAVVGGSAGLLLEDSFSAGALARAGLILGIFLAGAAAACWKVTRVNVMKLMKVEE